MEYTKDYLRGRYNLRRLYKLNRLRIKYQKRSKSLKHIVKHHIPVNLFTVIYRLINIGCFNLINLSKLISYSDYDSIFMLINLQDGGHLAQADLLKTFSKLGFGPPPVLYSLFFKSSV